MNSLCIDIQNLNKRFHFIFHSTRRMICIQHGPKLRFSYNNQTSLLGMKQSYNTDSSSPYLVLHCQNIPHDSYTRIVRFLHTKKYLKWEQNSWNHFIKTEEQLVTSVTTTTCIFVKTNRSHYATDFYKNEMVRLNHLLQLIEL